MSLGGSLVCSVRTASSVAVWSASPGSSSALWLSVLERCYPKEVQDLYDGMRRFARVIGPIEHDKFIESHACE